MFKEFVLRGTLLALPIILFSSVVAMEISPEEALFAAIETSNKNEFDRVLANNIATIDVDYVRELDSHTPLSLACSKGNFSMVKELVIKGANRGELREKQMGFFEQPVKRMVGGKRRVKRTFVFYEGAPWVCPWGEGVVKDINGNWISQDESSQRLPLYEAIKNNHVEIVKFLVSNFPKKREKRQSVSQSDFVKIIDQEAGYNALHVAVESGNIEIVKYILTLFPVGSDERAEFMNLTTYGCESALHLAVKTGDLGLVSYIVASFPVKADIWKTTEIISLKNFINKNSIKRGSSALHLAVEGNFQDIVGYLVKVGASINIRDDIDRTPLHRAAEKGYLEIVKYLIENKADLMAVDKYGLTPLDLARTNKKDAVVAFLESCLFGAVKPSVKKPGQLLLDAIEKGHLIDVKNAIEKQNAGIETIGRFGHTPLLAAVSYSGKQRVAIIKYLVGQGANINAVDSLGNTPLYHAAFNENIEIINFLIDNGADIALVNKANFSAKKCVENAILFDAINSGDITKVRAAYGIGVQINVDANRRGEKLIHRAVANGLKPVIRFLAIEKGANLNIGDAKGNTVLHHLVSSESPERIELMIYLIDLGANVNKQNTRGATPLQEACAWGNYAMASVLIERGALIDTRDVNGDTALIIAVRAGHFEVAELLIKNGADEMLINTFGQSAFSLSTGFSNSSDQEKILLNRFFGSSYKIRWTKFSGRVGNTWSSPWGKMAVIGGGVALAGLVLARLKYAKNHNISFFPSISMPNRPAWLRVPTRPAWFKFPVFRWMKKSEAAIPF